MAQINFIRTDDIDKIAHSDGNFIIVSTGEIYADFPSERVRLSYPADLQAALQRIIYYQERLINEGVAK